MRLEQAHLRPAFGRGDRRGQPRQPAADNRDPAHRDPSIGCCFIAHTHIRRIGWSCRSIREQLVRYTVPVMARSKRASWHRGCWSSWIAGSEAPLHEQIERSIREDIRAGRLAAGARLPSTRGLAAELGISRGVVSEAYGQLAAEGYLLASQGAPTRVAHTVRGAGAAPIHALAAAQLHLPPRPRPARPRRLPARPLAALAARRLAPGADRRRRLPRPARRAGAARDARRVPGARPRRRRRPRAADRLHRLRPGPLADRPLAARSRRRAASRSRTPAGTAHRLIVEQAGLEVVPVPVDGEGLRVDALEESDAAAVVVTPAHQFPTGRVLSSERRAALIEWAERGERLIVEDDFDAELRYDRTRVGALQGLAPERVAYIGSASKRLVPGMRLGWMLAPSWLGWPLISVKAIEDRGSEAIGQLALQDFIARGELDRHLRRMRLRYQRPPRGAARSAGRHLPEARVERGRRRPLRAGRAARGRRRGRPGRRRGRARGRPRGPRPAPLQARRARRASCSASPACPSRRSSRASATSAAAMSANQGPRS